MSEVSKAFRRVANVIYDLKSVSRPANSIPNRVEFAAILEQVADEMERDECRAVPVETPSRRIDFKAREMPSGEWVLDLLMLIFAAHTAIYAGQPDAAEKWRACCEHWLTRYTVTEETDAN